ncbi:ABC transporter permease [Treponema sp.]|uniref:ABC transporter permease n=1 Tax=Treponema sp. TaxID=166 RepID=UPI00388FC38C
MISLFKNLYRYRQMLFSLVHRELRGRYKGSVLGFLWTFLNPLLQMFVYTFVFSIIMRSNIEKYYLFLFVALVPWIFFSTSLTGGCACILNSADMVKKIYFPREILPLSFVTTAFVNMLYCFIVVFAVLFISGIGFNFLALIYLPLILLIEYIFTLGISLLSSALTVYFRDLQHILGIFTLAWQMLTPVMYSSKNVPDRYLTLFNMNPMTPIVEAFRSILYYKEIPHLENLLSAVLFGVVFLLLGELVFSKLQKGFAEEL